MLNRSGKASERIGSLLQLAGVFKTFFEFRQRLGVDHVLLFGPSSAGLSHTKLQQLI
jgi:hypothetical protein